MAPGLHEGYALRGFAGSDSGAVAATEFDAAAATGFAAGLATCPRMG
jgi:hypothetical protein